MMEFSKIEDIRQDILKKYEKELIAGILSVILAVIIGFASITLELGPLIFIGFVIFVISIIFFSKAYKHHQTFKSVVKDKVITELVKSSFLDVSYHPKNHISISRINQTEMIRRPDRFSGEDLIIGKYKDISFEVSDIDLKQRVETRNSKGVSHVSYQTYFKGRWYIFKFERTFNEKLKIVEGSGFSLNKKGLVKMDTESIEFNKKFLIFASSLEFGFFIITPILIEKLLQLEKMHRGSICYAFIDHELHVGVNDNKDYMELSITKPINDETIKSLISDIDMIPAIINELKLDSQKFKNQK
jgi:hypothetical protein